MRQFLRWDVITMFIAIAALLTVELVGVFKKDCITITYIFHTYIPGWLLAMVWGWLGWHFFWRYR